MTNVCNVALDETNIEICRSCDTKSFFWRSSNLVDQTIQCLGYWCLGLLPIISCLLKLYPSRQKKRKSPVFQGKTTVVPTNTFNFYVGGRRPACLSVLAISRWVHVKVMVRVFFPPIFAAATRVFCRYFDDHSPPGLKCTGCLKFRWGFQYAPVRGWCDCVKNFRLRNFSMCVTSVPICFLAISRV